jgi:hypothetical protein
MVLREGFRSTGCTVAEPDSSVGVTVSRERMDSRGASWVFTATAVQP